MTRQMQKQSFRRQSVARTKRSHSRKNKWYAVVLLLSAIIGLSIAHSAWAQDKKPNILVIMGDDVGWFNIGAYHQGIMSGKTPNLDKLAAQGMRFTDYYAEASCTAGRANFITGELPIRTGLTTVGGADDHNGARVHVADLVYTVEMRSVTDRPTAA
jgi:hypothetical protein